MSVFDAIQHQPLLYCVLIGIAFASFCELRLIRQSSRSPKRS
jgi:hypothetical protein